MGLWRHGGTERSKRPPSSPSVDAMQASPGAPAVSSNCVRKGVPSGGQALNPGGAHVAAGMGQGGSQAPPLKGQAGETASAGPNCVITWT